MYAQTLRFLIWPLIIGSSLANAQQCPAPPTAIDVSIQESHEYDKKNQDYTYTYKATNGPRAKLDIFLVQFEASQDVEVISIPTKWRKSFRPEHEKYPSYLSFSSSLNRIPVNSKPYVFRIKSKLPPGVTRYYSSGSLKEVPTAVTINGDTEAAPDCPGFYFDAETVLEERVTGFTIGPVPTNQAEVKIKMKVKKVNPPRDWDDESDEPEISAIDKGKVEVVVYGTKGLDLSLIDLKSLQFGPAKAAPISAKLVTNSSHFNHWKKKPDDKVKKIWMEFNLADLQIRCDLDKALFLKAKAGEKNILGAVTIKPVVCNPKIWKQMGIERKWPAKHHSEH